MPIDSNGIIKPLSRSAAKIDTREGVGYWFGRACDGGNLTTVSVPIIGRAYVHKRIAEAFVGVFRDIEAAGDAGLVDLDDYGGTYNCRNVRGSTVKSPHAWGIAMDLNVHAFRAADGSEYRSSSATNFHCRRDQIAPSLLALAAYFTHWGFSWGGNWNAAYIDPMHFEATEQTIFVLDAGGPDVPTTKVARKVVVLPGYERAMDPIFHEDTHYVSVRDVAAAFDYELIDRREEDGKLYLRKRIDAQTKED